MSVRRPGRLGAAQMTARFLIEQARALLLVDREFCQDFVRPRESWIFIEILSEEAGQVDEHADSRLRAEVPSRTPPHFPDQGRKLIIPHFLRVFGDALGNMLYQPTLKCAVTEDIKLRVPNGQHGWPDLGFSFADLSGMTNSFQRSLIRGSESVIHRLGEGYSKKREIAVAALLSS